MSRSNGSPSGSRKVALVRVMAHPRWSTSSPTFWNRGMVPSSDVRPPGPPASADVTETDQTGVASLGPDQCRSDQLPEERMGLIGSALELGVGLGADPEGMTGEFDE